MKVANEKDRTDESGAVLDKTLLEKILRPSDPPSRLGLLRLAEMQITGRTSRWSRKFCGTWEHLTTTIQPWKRQLSVL